MSKCMFYKEKKVCKALNECKCTGCKFYITRAEYEAKEEKVENWYLDRGIPYDRRKLYMGVEQ